jgi:hypothetical protein
MTQATAIAMVAMFLSLMVGVIALIELHAMTPKAATRVADVVERDIPLLDEIEFEVDYSIREADAWDMEAYRLYLEDVR